MRSAKKAMVALSVLGLIVSLYLVLIHYAGVPLLCSDSGVINCSAVINSAYSVILGVPVADYGLVFFIIELVILLVVAQSSSFEEPYSREIRLVYNGVGLAFVFYLIYIEYLLQKICIYCTAIHIIVIALFLLSFVGPEPKDFYKTDNPY